MKDLNQMQIQQKDFIEHLTMLTKKYISSLDKTKITTVLLSGSVARGDYFPGKLGGFVDLVIMTKDSNFNKEQILGKDTEPYIPYHCVQTEIDGEQIGFEIDVCPFISVDGFKIFEEPRKWSILESKILYDENNLYKNELVKIKKVRDEELKFFLEGTLFGIENLINDYICDKWLRREAYVQLHENLNKAIELAIHCLYYINGSYVGPDNRLIYYTYSFNKLPLENKEEYAKFMQELMKQDIQSEDDFFRRKRLFEETFLSFLKQVK